MENHLKQLHQDLLRYSRTFSDTAKRIADYTPGTCLTVRIPLLLSVTQLQDSPESLPSF